VPDRLDRVQIQFASVDEPIVISWDTRDELVDRLRLRADGATAVEAFRAVGASSPVRLTIDEKEQLLIVIDEWMCELGSGYLPDGVFDLRSALINDLHDADRGPKRRTSSDEDAREPWQQDSSVADLF
jgi:hypothetical protein